MGTWRNLAADFGEVEVHGAGVGGGQHRAGANGPGRADYPLHDDFLWSEALGRSKAKHGSFLLSQAYPEAAPMHSSYPGGAASSAGVTAILLKAFFDESRLIADPVQPDARDPTRLVPYAEHRSPLAGKSTKWR